MPKITLTGQKDKERAVFCTISEKFLYIYFATGREAKNNRAFSPAGGQLKGRPAGPFYIQKHIKFAKE